jgi:splicing factor 3A subunit 1
VWYVENRKPDETVELCIVAFAEIDWHNYIIVQTIEFTAANATAELPPLMSMQEVENMTLT